MALSRNNHYIPQMYLRNWESSKDKIFVYRLLVSNEKVPLWTEQAIDRTASMPNLYCRVQDKEETDDFEIDFNKRFETPAVAPLNKLINDEKLSPNEWEIVIDYVVAQLVRTPKFHQRVCREGREQMPKILDAVTVEVKEAVKENNITKKAEKSDSILPLSVDVNNWHEDDNTLNLTIETVVGKNLWLQAMKIVLSRNSSIRNTFKNLKWSVVTACNGISWPTCDSPVIICGITKDNMLFKTDGLGINDKVIVFPISPTKALIGCRKRIFTWRFTADLEFTLNIKRVITQNAFLYVYNNHEDADIPKYYKRLVNEEEFKRVNNSYGEWYDDYLENEGPYLTAKPNIKYTS